MGIFKNKFKLGDILKEQAPEYWEETSYFRILPGNSPFDKDEDIINRINSIDGVSIIDAQPFEIGKPGKIVLSYKDEIFEVGYYIDDFHFSDLYNVRNYFFSENEMSAIRIAEQALVLFMDFKPDSKLSYHLQVKLAVAMVPDMLAVLDESAEMIINARWMQLAAQSSVLPGASSLFTVQAVSDPDNKVWLHTHGLTRCGLYELEILDSDIDHYNDHYHILSTLASRLLDKEDDMPQPLESVVLGMFEDRTPILATYIPWTKGLDEYPRKILGGLDDRKNSHNTHSAFIFLYDSPQNEKRKKVSKISDFNEQLRENPLLFLSDSETQRMSALARERFGLVKYMADKQVTILVKVGLKVDSDETGSEREHIWVELQKVEGDKYYANLIQEPYDIKALHEGDTIEFTIDDVTDWKIYLEDFSVEPNTAYLLI